MKGVTEIMHFPGSNLGIALGPVQIRKSEIQGHEITFGIERSVQPVRRDSEGNWQPIRWPRIGGSA